MENLWKLLENPWKTSTLEMPSKEITHSDLVLLKYFFLRGVCRLCLKGVSIVVFTFGFAYMRQFCFFLQKKGLEKGKYMYYLSFLGFW